VDRTGWALVLAVLNSRVLCTQFGKFACARHSRTSTRRTLSLATKAQTACHTGSEDIQIALNHAIC